MLPLVFIVCTAVIVFNQLASDPIESAIGLLIVLAGLPIYYLRAARLDSRSVTDADH